MDITVVTAIFGWMSVLHIGFLSFASLILVIGRRPVSRIHSGLMRLPESEFPKLYFNYLANYKIFSMCTSIVPYVALKLV
jgi:hypothetical protein